MIKTTRRNFFKASSLLFMSACSVMKSVKKGPLTFPPLSDISPLYHIASRDSSRTFSGDDPSVPHGVLWNKQTFLREQPVVSEEMASLVVVGGGMSGLLSAYLHRDQKPIVLEQARRFGGNSKGEIEAGLPYSIGAAYFTAPDPDTNLETLLKELGLLSEAVVKKEEDPIEFKGKIEWELWKGTHPQIVRLAKYFKRVLESDGIPFPDIPVLDASMRPMIDELDRESFLTHVEGVAGGKLPLTAYTAIEQYCWSSFGGSAKEISAASGLNFYAGEMGDVLVYPGGNSYVAARLLEKLKTMLPRENLRTQALVLDVEARGDEVLVKYVDEAMRVRQIRTQTVIMACPKFVVKHVLTDIEEKRRTAIERLSYRSYHVANVLLKNAPAQRFYDLYLLGHGHAKGREVQEEALHAGVTDVILANYAATHYGNGEGENKAVLTLYRALPYEGARPWLLGQSYESLQRDFQQQIEHQILPVLGLSPSSVTDVRLTRWGHPLPLAKRGLIAEGIPDIIRAPFRERVFFVEQDNWALPCFETVVDEAYTMKSLIAQKTS